MTLTALLSLLFCAVSALSAPLDVGESPWQGTKCELQPGEVSLRIAPEAAPLTLGDHSGIASTGVPSLDAVAGRYGVYQIRKAFRMKEPPKEPDIPDLSRYYHVWFSDPVDPREVAEAYSRCDEVELAEPVPAAKQLFVPNDPLYRSQWHLSHCGFEEAWEVSHGSEEIVIGIVDSGVDMDADGMFGIHEDLRGNLWVNPGEDLNGDGMIDWDEYNFEDDDDNDYVDDFYGWDFTAGDNWPDDYWGEQDGHGTHVAGIASAVTDNDTGVAGAGFNCKLMVAACYNQGSPTGGFDSYDTNRGIEYCTDNGARAINLSFGFFGPPYNAQLAVINYALRHHVAVFAGAGNDAAEDRREDLEHFYPCAYDGVIGVGASDERDDRASFSNYGDFTDLIAPGVSIISTFPRNNYMNLQGTSMSTPLAAGLGALLLSRMPDLTPDEMLALMQETATDISEQNQDYPGIVYRINADRLLNYTHPEYSVACQFLDPDGDNDGRPDPGETVFLALTIGNEGGHVDANNITIRLENEDPFVRIVGGEVQLEHLESGDQIELPVDDRLSFRVRENCGPHYSTFILTISSNENWTATVELPVTIGHPYYLLMDDDGGSRFEEHYLSDLGERPIVHDTWNTLDQGSPTQEELNGYSFVIWETGNAEDPLTPEEQSLVAGFLDGGGCLLLSGQFIGDAIGGSDFHRNYLHAQHLTDNTHGRQLAGVGGHPISDGVLLVLLGATGAGNGTLSPSSMVPLNGADTLFYYGTEEDPGEVGGVIYEGEDYTLVYLGFALESVSGLMQSTPRREFTLRVLDYFWELGVGETPDEAIPTAFELADPYPNPFNSQTSVRASVPAGQRYRFEVFDLAGRSVALLHDGESTGGNPLFTWTPGNAPTGIYLFKLTWNSGATIRKAALIR